MSNVVESFVSKLKFDVNTRDLEKARNSVDLMKKATKALEDEQRKQTQASAKSREDLHALRKELHAGTIDKKKFKERTTAVRLAMHDEANEARRTTIALKALRVAEKGAAEAAREQAKAHRAAAADADKASKSYERMQDAAFGSKGGPRRAGDALRGGKGGGDNPYAPKRRQAKAGMSDLATTAVGTAAGGIIAGAAVGAVRALGDAMVDSFDKAVKFESAMADVAKVVDGLKTPTGEITAEYTRLSDELKTLSTRIAVTPDGLAEMASAAGSAGIKGAELSRFVEDAAKTMVAFDITSEEAGNGLSKLRANLGLNQEEVMGLAGTMNHLSNSMASTAAEVLDATLRVGAVGKAANVSGQEVAGLASAMISAGATSEIAATATKTFILTMASGEAATKRQREAFSKLGLDSKDVAKQFTGSAEQRSAVISKVFSELGKLDNAGRASMTMNLFGRESLGPIASLTTNVKAFEEAMRLAKDQVAGAASVQKEYDVRSKTTANAMQLLSNNIDVVKINLGEAMIPVMNEAGGMLVKIAKDVGDWVKENKDLIATGLDAFMLRAVQAADKLWPILEKVGHIVGTLTGDTGKLGTVFDVVMASVGLITGSFDVMTSTLSGLLTIVSGLVDAFAAFGRGDIAAGFVSLGNAIVSGILEPLRAVVRQVIALADATGANVVPDAVREFAGLGAKSISLKDNDDDGASQTGRSSSGLGISTAGRSSVALGFGEGQAPVAMARGKSGKPGALPSGAAGPSAESIIDAKTARFHALDARRKKLKPSERKEYNALSKELDLAKTTGGGGGRKKKDETSGFEGDIEGEIGRLSKEAGNRAGIKSAAAGMTRKQQYAAAKQAEADTKAQLQGRVDAGGTLPGSFHKNLLDSAGFSDVAGRGTPPPIAVSIIDVKPMNVHVEFTGPVETDMRVVREGVIRILRTEIPQQLAAGIREAKTPVLY